ncbi:hypothetical protein QTP88_028598 [Uroleucon formosanum]
MFPNTLREYFKKTQTNLIICEYASTYVDITPDKKMLPKKLKWVIVIFTSSKDYSVVSINWLLETEVENL